MTYTPADQQLVLSCGSQLRLEPRSGRLHLRILADRLSVEVFANRGEVSLTHCVRAADGSPPLSLQVVGGPAFIKSLEVRELKSIWTGETGNG